MALPELMTLREVAQVLRLSEGTVRRSAKEGRIPEPVRVSGRLRWREDEIADLLGGRA